MIALPSPLPLPIAAVGAALLVASSSAAARDGPVGFEANAPFPFGGGGPDGRLDTEYGRALGSRAAAGGVGGGDDDGPPPRLPFGFDTVFGDNMVLQQAPAKAAVYGFLGPDGGCCASVTASVLDGLHGRVLHTSTAEINATQQPFGPSWGVRPCDEDTCPPYGMGQYNPWNEPLPTWKALLRPFPAGGNYTIEARCDAAAAGSDSNSGSVGGCPPDVPPIVNITNVTFGDVWYCSGQSNMWLPVQYTFHRNETVEGILGGRYDNLRLMAGDSGNHPRGPGGAEFEGYGHAGGSNPWTTARQAVSDGTVEDPKYSLFKFGAACWYFGQRLSELGVAAPIGLIDTAIGGQRIEEFMDNGTIGRCSNRSGENIPWWDGERYATQVLAFVDMTVRGWVWYQGENNMGGVKGNAAFDVGYGCEMRELVRGWRKVWSATPGTTDPLASFGVVTLASSGGEGQPGMGPMRHAQTVNYGVLPNDMLPNTFLAQAYDLDDEWGPAKGPCIHNWSCCDFYDIKYDPEKCNSTLKRKCANACAASDGTPVTGGAIHSRSKKWVGDRLGDAAFNSVYGGGAPYTGPTFSGCELTEDGRLLVRFNDTLLRGESIRLNPIYPPQPPTEKHHVIAGGSQLFVQTDASHFCMEPRPSGVEGEMVCPGWAGGSGNSSAASGLDDGWIMLNYTLGSRSSISVDLDPLGNLTPTAIRYAWGIVDCCDHDDPDLYVTHGCIASCPIVGATSNLPANPFMAKIDDGVCACLPPQVCSSASEREEAKDRLVWYLVVCGVVGAFVLLFLFVISWRKCISARGRFKLLVNATGQDPPAPPPEHGLC